MPATKPSNPTKQTKQQAIGNHAESLACDFLQTRGLRLVARNFRCKGGELDLVMLDQDTVVFVEVRARKGSRYGSALESVTYAKQRRLIHAANYFILRNDPQHKRSYRFDVVAIQGEPGNNPDIQWIKSAF